MGKLVEKSAKLLAGFKDYKALYVGYGLEDV
jgi:uncharacterized short protein YbdD (DUF466 family)